MVRHHHHNLHRLLLNTDTAAPPLIIGSRGSSGSHGGGGGNFDNNMMVILAALLCALIGAIVINSIIRCATRCSQRFQIDPDRVLSELPPTGLSKNALSQIPVVAYEPGLEIPVKECCPICLGEFSGGEKVRILPKCGHGFHVKCIDTWLLSHSSCPNCRVSVI
jgi:E3 ubiquitin-protein ligase ATL10/75/76/77/78